MVHIVGSPDDLNTPPTGIYPQRRLNVDKRKDHSRQRYELSSHIFLTAGLEAPRGIFFDLSMFSEENPFLSGPFSPFSLTMFLQDTCKRNNVRPGLLNPSRHVLYQFQLESPNFFQQIAHYSKR